MIEEPLIQLEEGLSLKPYLCSEGFPTIGTGTRIGPKGASLEYYQFVITEEIANLLMRDRITRLKARLSIKYLWFNKLNKARQAVIISMCYQFGLTGFSKFHNTIKYLSLGEYDSASNEMLDSLWYKIQTPERAARHSQVILFGDFEQIPYYDSLV